jgi:branched-subunit amino acid ABC-type transport system permease component
VTAALTALALGVAYALIGAGVAVVATAARTLHLAVGQVLVAGVLVHLVLGSAVLGLPVALTLALALLAGALLSAALEPLVLRPLPSGLGWLVGLVVAAGVLDAALARGVTARTFRPEPLLDLGGLAGLDAGVATAVVLGLPATGLLALALTRTRWGRRVRLVGGSSPAAELAGISPSRVRAQALAVGGAATVLSGLLVAPVAFVGTGQAAGFTVRGVAAAALLGTGGPAWALAGGLVLGAVEVGGGALWPQAGGEVAVAGAVLTVLLVRGGTHLRAWGRTW